MLTSYLVNSPHNIYAHNSLEKISFLLQAERNNYCSGPNLPYHKMRYYRTVMRNCLTFRLLATFFSWSFGDLTIFATFNVEVVVKTWRVLLSDSEKFYRK